MTDLSPHFELHDSRSDMGGGHRGRLLTHIFFILFCLEIGLVLVVLPWTFFWDNNLLFHLTPAWEPFWFSTYLRGAVSGIGIVNLWIGLGEIWNLRR